MDRGEAAWMRRSPRRALVVALAALAIILTLGPVSGVVAQEMIVTGPEAYDRVRLSGLWWYGEVRGTVRAPQLDELPGSPEELDARDDLGIEGGNSGWLVAAEVAVAPRHRFLFAFAGLGQQGASETAIDRDTTLAASTDLSLRDVRGAYKFQFVRGGWIDAGVIGGVGYFDSRIELGVDLVAADDESEIPVFLPAVDLAEDFQSAYPIIGASVYFDAEDVLAVYTEITGFPSVEVAGQRGWVMNLTVDFFVYPTADIGVIAGYKRYQLSLEDGGGVGFDLVWDGFVIGAQYQF